MSTPWWRAAHSATRTLLIALVGLFQRPSIDGDGGIQRLVVFRDAIEVLPDDLARRHALVFHRLLHLGDRRLDDRKVRRPGRHGTHGK
jgi:hypothetical protein